jgi:hypothetical protein
MPRADDPALQQIRIAATQAAHEDARAYRAHIDQEIKPRGLVFASLQPVQTRTASRFDPFVPR